MKSIIALVALIAGVYVYMASVESKPFGYSELPNP